MRRVTAALLVIAAALAAHRAAAEGVYQLRPLSGAFDATAIAPFDPSLGTLDRVDVEIAGMLSLSVSAPPNVLPPSPGTPAPYDFTGSAEQLLFGLGGRAFEFQSGAEFLFNGHASGVGGNQLLAQPIRYRFAFTEASDVAGFTLATPIEGALFQPPTSITGARADWLPIPGAPGIEIDMIARPGRTFGSVPQVGLLGASFGGTLSVLYRYTPPPAQPSVQPDELVFHTSATGVPTQLFAFDPALGTSHPIETGSDTIAFPLVGSPLVDANGNLLIVHENNRFYPDVVVVKRVIPGAQGRIETITALGGASGKPGAALPRDVLLLPGGDLVICEQGGGPNNSVDGRLLRVDPNSGAVSLISNGVLVNPNQIALAADGEHLFVADVQIVGPFLAQGRLQRVDVETGAVETLFTGAPLIVALDLGVAPDGRVFWLDAGGSLFRFDPAAAAIAPALVAAQLGQPVGVGIDAAGHVLVSRIAAPGSAVTLAAIDPDAFDAGNPLANQIAAGTLLANARAPGVVIAKACGNGRDDDHDGAIDDADAGCASRFDPSETDDCDNGIDDDDDGLVDGTDTGCASPLDPSERPACSDGLDLDADGYADYYDDPGCASPESPVEDPACDNGVDDDGDGSVDLLDIDCAAPSHPSESGAVCGNALDDDRDGKTDYPDDPGCRTATSTTESPACDDGFDNDGDGFSDLDDEGCDTAYRDAEDPSCGDDFDNDGDGAVDLADSDCEFGSEDGGGITESIGPISGWGCGLGAELALLPWLARRFFRARGPRTRRYHTPG